MPADASCTRKSHADLITHPFGQNFTPGRARLPKFVSALPFQVTAQKKKAPEGALFDRPDCF
jgi:hypothetical protein